MKDQIKEALDAGYSQQEILNYLKKDKPDLYDKFQEAINEGYSPKEIFSHFSGESIQEGDQEPTSDNEILPTAETLKQVPLGIARLTGRGLSSLVSAPSKGIGGLLQLVSSFGDEEYPGVRALKAAGEYLSDIGKGGQDQMNQYIEDILGQSYGSGEEFLTKSTERAANIYGQLPLQGLGQASILGGLSGQLAEAAGAPEPVQIAAEIAGMIAPNIGRAASALIKKPVVSESGIQLPKVVEREGAEFGIVKPKVTAARKEKVLEKLDQQAENLISKIKKEKLPIAQEIEKGVDVEARNSINWQKTKDIAKKLPEDIDTTNISNYLENYRNEIEAIPVPTEEQEGILKLIDRYEKAYKAPEGTTKFFKPEKFVEQRININKDLKKLYETKFIHGERKATQDFYSGLQKQFLKDIENNTPKAFSDLYKEVNTETSQLKRLEKFESIFESLTDNGRLAPKKLETFLKNPKKINSLKAQIGKDGTDKLKLISKDLASAHKNINLIKSFGILDTLTGAAPLGLLKLLGLTSVKAAAIPAYKGLQLARGYMLTSPQGARNISNFLKSVRSGSKKAMIRYAETLNEDIKKYEKERN